MAYDTELMRKLLTELFSEEKFMAFCYDHFRDVYNTFSNSQNRAEKIQLFIKHCESYDLFPQVLERLKAANPAGYRKLMREYAHGEVGLPATDVDPAIFGEVAVRTDFNRLGDRPVPPTAARDDVLTFKDRQNLRDRIVQSSANHIELYGPVGVGKTYLLKHLAQGLANVFTVYVDLSSYSYNRGSLLSEIVGQLVPGKRGMVASEKDLAPAIWNRIHKQPRPEGQPAPNHFIFAFDSVTESHQEIIAWLFGRDGLINHQQFCDTLTTLELQPNDPRLQVIIAVRRPLAKAEYHNNFFFDRLPIDRLEKHLNPKADPIQCIIRELVEKVKFPHVAEKTYQRLSDEIYYLTGGHPLCAKQLLLALPNDDFTINSPARWKELFEQLVSPIIRQELLGNLPNPDLVPIFWVLSVFRYFDQRLLADLIERGIIAVNDGYNDASRSARQLRKYLVDTYLVDEPGDKDALAVFRINYSYRRVLSLSMQYGFTERFRLINSTALEISLDRLQRGEIKEDRAVATIIEIVYHWLKAFELNGTDGPTVTQTLRSGLQKNLPLLLNWIDEPDRSTYLPMLLNQWKRDDELKETAQRVTGSAACYNALSEDIACFVRDNQ